LSHLTEFEILETVRILIICGNCQGRECLCLFPGNLHYILHTSAFEILLPHIVVIFTKLEYKCVCYNCKLLDLSGNLPYAYHIYTFVKFCILARDLQLAKTSLNYNIRRPFIFFRSEDYRLKSEMQVWYVPPSTVTRSVYAMTGSIPNHRIRR
jgi:hypothetical protein